MTEAPDPAGGELLAGAAELTPATFAPVAVVAVGGVDVASGAAGPGDSLMVVDGVRTTWGRDDVLDQPTPATGRLVLFDATRTWATDADRRGQAVTIRYEGTAPGGATVSAVFFRGRIGSPIRVRPKSVHHRITGQLVRGSLVELPLQSAELDLANVVPRGAYPAETLGARVDRVVATAQAAGHLSGGGDVRAYWRTPNVAPVEAKDQRSLLAQLTALFDSAGADSYAYRPHTDEVRHVPRRNFPTTPAMGRLWWDGTDPTKARAGQGAYIRATSVALAPASDDADGIYLDAGSLEYDPTGDGVTTPARITRVAITHPDEGNAYASRSVEFPVTREPWDPAGGHVPLDEKVLGVRTARIESLVAWNNYAELSAQDTTYLVRREGSRWLLDALRLSTRKLGGFETVAQAQLLLAGYERNTHLFLQRSFLPSYGIRPVFGVMGATVTYARQGWDVEFALAPVVTQIRQHSLTAEDLAAEPSAYQIEAWDAPHPKGLHPSVTAEDLRYCGIPLSGTLPAETEQDEYQT